MKNAVVFVSVLSAIYALIQIFIYYSTGIVLITGLPVLSQRFGLDAFENSQQIFEAFGYRPSSFFIEPAHLAQYCTIGALLLVGDLLHGNKGYASLYNLAKIALLLAAPLAAGSSTAVLSVLFVLFVVFAYVFITYLSHGVVNSRFLLIIIAAVVIGVLAFSLNLQAISRLSSGVLSGSIAVETSAIFVRVLRPFIYISSLIERGQLSGLAFGYGFGAYERLIDLSGFETDYENSSQIYWVNTFGMLVSAVGLVGFFLFLLIFGAILQHSNRNARVLVFYLASSFFFSDMAASAYAFLVVALAISPKKALG